MFPRDIDRHLHTGSGLVRLAKREDVVVSPAVGEILEEELGVRFEDPRSLQGLLGGDTKPPGASQMSKLTNEVFRGKNQNEIKS